MKINKGFTLIELLVVIAIIGVLSSIVMSSIGKSREKAHDASAKATLNGVRAQSALYYNENNFSYGDSGTDCATVNSVFDPTKDNNINSMVLAAQTVVGGGDTACANDSVSYVVAVTLQGGGVWCVDSNGYASTTLLALTSTGGVTEKIACE
ncbi:MAG: type II secretion system protein [Minisyncoccia bacterium]